MPNSWCRGTRTRCCAARSAGSATSRTTRAGFADPAVAAEVLRQVQVLTLTPTLATLDYTCTAPKCRDRSDLRVR
jgi:hypothetical protein